MCRINVIFSLAIWMDIPPQHPPTLPPRTQMRRLWFLLAALGQRTNPLKKKNKKQKKKELNIFDMFFFLLLFLKILLCTFIAYVLFYFLYRIVMALVLYLKILLWIRACAVLLWIDYVPSICLHPAFCPRIAAVQ